MLFIRTYLDGTGGNINNTRYGIYYVHRPYDSKITYTWDRTNFKWFKDAADQVQVEGNLQ